VKSGHKNEEPGHLSIAGLDFLIETEWGNLLAAQGVRLGPASDYLIDMAASSDHNYPRWLDSRFQIPNGWMRFEFGIRNQKSEIGNL